MSFHFGFMDELVKLAEKTPKIMFRGPTEQHQLKYPVKIKKTFADGSKKYRGNFLEKERGWQGGWGGAKRTFDRERIKPKISTVSIPPKGSKQRSKEKRNSIQMGRGEGSYISRTPSSVIQYHNRK